MTKTSYYWLHVAEDGGETVYSTRPRSLPSLKVEVRGRYETTETFNIVVDGHRRSVPPKGEGWTLADMLEVSCLWRRKRKRRLGK
jgi:hypothetical protein